MRTAVVNPSLAPSMNASYTLIFLDMPATINPTMMSMSRMLVTDTLTLSTIMASSCIKPHTMAAMKRLTPPRAGTKVRLNRLMR